jgi:hypothetical protein
MEQPGISHARTSRAMASICKRYHLYTLITAPFSVTRTKKAFDPARKQ